MKTYLTIYDGEFDLYDFIRFEFNCW